MSTESLNCPNCGAPLLNAGGAATLVCDHCGSVVAIKILAAPGPNAQPADWSARPDPTTATLDPADAFHVTELLRAHREDIAIMFYQAKIGCTMDEAIAALKGMAIRAGLPG